MLGLSWSGVLAVLLLLHQLHPRVEDTHRHVAPQGLREGGIHVFCLTADLIALGEPRKEQGRHNTKRLLRQEGWRNGPTEEPTNTHCERH